MGIIIKWLFLLSLFVPLKIFDTHVVQDTKSVPCLAYTIFHEANLEPLEGKRAVYETILTRMKRTGKSACEIVLEKNQFSGMSQAKIDTVDEKMLANFWKMLYNTSGKCECTHFHHVGVSPQWKYKFKFVKQINLHRFYMEEKHGRRSQRSARSWQAIWQ